jgi:hypothetical protein
VALDKAGITPKRAMEIIGSLPVISPAGNSVASLMVAEDYAPRFTTTLIPPRERLEPAKRAWTVLRQRTALQGASFMVMPRRPVAITQSSPCRGRRFFADANNMGRQSASDCAGRWMERDRPSSSSRSAGLAKVETRWVPSPNLLKSLAGATGLEPAISGVTGRQID